MREVYRRMLLVAGVVGALCLIRWASLAPLLVVEPVDMVEAQAKGRRFGVLDRETMTRLGALSIADYPTALTEGRRFAARGPAWEAFTAKVLRFYAEPAAVPDWRWRATSIRYGGRPADLWFGPDEAPLAELAPLFDRSATVFVAVDQGAAPAWLMVHRVTYSAEDYTPFFGFSGHTPPRAFQYPLLAWAWVPLALGLLGYVLLTWPRREATEVYHPTWGLVVTDLVFLVLLFIPFFGLAFALGGPVQTFSRWWGLALVLWPISGLALWGLRFSAWYGSFGLRLGADGLILATWGRTERVAFSEIASWARGELRPHRWLIRLLWLGALSGRPGLAGQARLQGSACYRGYILRLGDGREFALWYTNQLGGSVLRHVEGLAAALKKAKVPFDRALVERRGFGAMDDGFRRPEASGSWLARRKQTLLLFATPLVVFLVALLLS